MPKIRKALVVVLPFIVAFGFCFRSASATTPPLSERALGQADAPVTVVECASLTCDHCKRFHIKVFPCLKEAHIDSGKVKFVYRHFPLVS